jgi:hypothetical protein
MARTGESGTIHLLADGDGGPVYLLSDDGARSWNATPVVNATAPVSGLEFHGWDMAVDQAGRVHVALGTNAWKLKLPAEEWGFYYTRMEPGGGAFEPVRNLNRRSSEGFSLAVSDRGDRVAAVWLAGKVYANLSEDGGDHFGPAIEFDPSGDACDCCTTSSVYTAGGNLAVLYRDETGNQRDMFLARSGPGLSTIARTEVSGTPWALETCPMTYFRLTRCADGFLAVWPTGTDYEINFTRLDPDGRPLPPGVVKTPGHAWHRTGVVALEGSGNRTLVAWNRDGSVGWQVFGPDGSATGEPGSVPTEGSGAAAALDREGRFVLFH